LIGSLDIQKRLFDSSDGRGIYFGLAIDKIGGALKRSLDPLGNRLNPRKTLIEARRKIMIAAANGSDPLPNLLGKPIKSSGRNRRLRPQKISQGPCGLLGQRRQVSSPSFRLTQDRWGGWISESRLQTMKGTAAEENLNEKPKLGELARAFFDKHLLRSRADKASVLSQKHCGSG
jgi:hypothetical protein